MKVKFRFNNVKESKLGHVSVSTFHFDKESSTGPVIMRGEDMVLTLDVKEGDLLEIDTTKFADEFDFKWFRRGRMLNQPSEREKAKSREKYKEILKELKLGKALTKLKLGQLDK